MVVFFVLSVDVGMVVMLSVEVVDVDGLVEKVDFYVGGVFVGILVKVFYIFNYMVIKVGLLVVYVCVIDNLGVVIDFVLIMLVVNGVVLVVNCCLDGLY